MSGRGRGSFDRGTRRNRRDPRRGRGRDRNSPFQKPTTKKLDSNEAVSILTYGSNTNFAIFKEKIKTSCLEKYGNLGRLIEDNAYWMPDEIDEEKYEPQTGESEAQKEMRKIELQSTMKYRLSTINEMKRNRPNMYAYIYSKLSTESEDEIKREADFSTFSTEVDPLSLWKAVNKTHLISVASTSKTVMKRNAFSEYAKCKQGAFEDLFKFKERFSMKYKAYETQGNAAKDEEDQAMDFLEGLDKSRYGEFIVETLNDVQKGAITQPKSVNEVYTLATKRLVLTKNDSGYGASYSTISTRAPRRKWRKPKDRDKLKKDKEDEDERKREHKSKSDATNPVKDETEKRRCYNFGKVGHLVRDCPDLISAAIKEENEIDVEEGDVPSVNTTIHTIASMSNPTWLEKYDFILDSGSQVSVAKYEFLMELYKSSSGFQ